MFFKSNKNIAILVLLLFPIITALTVYPSLVINMLTLHGNYNAAIGFGIILSSALLIGIFCWIESNVRSSILATLSNTLFNRHNSLDEMEKVESVNFTSAVEKYTWSLADTIKFGAMMIGSLVLLALSSWQSAITSVAILTAIYLISRLFVNEVVSARRKLEYYSKNIVETSKNISSKSFFFNQKATQLEIKTEIDKTLSNYTRYRMRITYYRSLVAIASTIYALILITSGIMLLKNSSALGLLFITVWFFSKDSLERLIDAYIVNLSEAIHAERIYLGSKPRESIVELDPHALEVLKKKSVSMLIHGPNGSGKSVLLKEIYFLLPNKTRYFDSKFFLNDNSVMSILKNLKEGETIIFDESIRTDSYPWLFEYLDQQNDMLEGNNNNIIIAAHGIEKDDLKKSVKTLFIRDAISLLVK